MKRHMDNKGTFKMLENSAEGIRYEFFTRAVQNSNVDKTVAYYVPVIGIRTRLILGSTYYTRDVSVEEGNQLYKDLLTKGFKEVTFETRTFA